MTPRLRDPLVSTISGLLPQPGVRSLRAPVRCLGAARDVDLVDVAVDGGRTPALYAGAVIDGERDARVDVGRGAGSTGVEHPVDRDRDDSGVVAMDDDVVPLAVGEVGRIGLRFDVRADPTELRDDHTEGARPDVPPALGRVAANRALAHQALRITARV